MDERAVGTVAPYGPDTTRASKLVASVVAGDGHGPIIASRTWTSEEVDLRHDGVTRAAVLAFFAMHGVREIGRLEKVIGCPHQEGIDYPMGRACPKCPFWATIDRFTHEPIRPPVATMTAEEVLERLASDPVIAPQRALASADALQSALVEPLLQALERAVDASAGATEEEASLFGYALYLLAKWRHSRAYPLVIRWLSLPDEEAFDLGGDMVTQDGPRILAAVCDGDLSPIRALALNSGANEHCRGVAVDALALLGAWAEIPRATAVEELTRVEGELERVPSQVWCSFAVTVADHAIQELLPAVHRAYDDGLVDSMTMQRSELDAVAWTDPGRALEKVRDRWPPIDDVAAATSWWDRRPKGQDTPADASRIPEKVGRNEPCPCGSGKKFKKCCGG